jgi:hypothetical protein
VKLLNYEGTGHRPIRVGRHVRYREADVQAWLELRSSGTCPVGQLSVSGGKNSAGFLMSELSEAARHVFQTWKPWLVFSNGAWPSGSIDWHEDTTPPSVMQKSYRWQQDGAPAAYVIEHLTDEGDVVCDPLVGTGSYGEAVVGLGREFIGCEADAGRFAKAVERLRSRNA